MLNNIPEFLTYKVLYLGTAHNAFLDTAGIKAIKIIKNPDGTHKLLGYYDTFDQQRKMISIQQNWGSSFLTWETQGSFGKKHKKITQNSKGTAFTENKKSSSQTSNSNKKTPPTKKEKQVITSAKKKELTKVLIEILNSIF